MTGTPASLFDNALTTLMTNTRETAAETTFVQAEAAVPGSGVAARHGVMVHCSLGY